jgi:hypothetical protein
MPPANAGGIVHHWNVAQVHISLRLIVPGLNKVPAGSKLRRVWQSHSAASESIRGASWSILTGRAPALDPLHALSVVRRQTVELCRQCWIPRLERIQ